MQNAVTIFGAGTVPAAASGATNIEDVAGAPAGSVIFLTPGYQQLSVLDASAITLVDTFGSAMLVGGTGNDTLLATGSGDTLQGGSGNDVMVSFNGTATETDAGSSGKNLFFGGAAPVTVQGGGGHDTAVLSSGGSFTTGGGGSQAWLGTGFTTIDSNGADTIVASVGSTGSRRTPLAQVPWWASAARSSRTLVAAAAYSTAAARVATNWRHSEAMRHSSAAERTI